MTPEEESVFEEVMALEKAEPGAVKKITDANGGVHCDEETFQPYVLYKGVKLYLEPLQDEKTINGCSTVDLFGKG